MRSAAELQELGRDAINAGRLGRARRLLTQALARDPSDEARARCLVSLAMVEAEQGDFASGLAICLDALDIPGLPAEVQGLVHSQLGLLRIRAGDAAGALRDMTTAEPLLTDRAALARLHLNRGNLHMYLDRPPAAAADFRRAHDLADNELTRAKALHNIATVELRLGDPVLALRMMEEADTVLEEHAPVLSAINAYSRAEALSACGLAHEAADVLVACARTYARLGDRQDQGEVELERARILLLIDPAESWRAARRAARLFARRGSDDWVLRARAVEFAAQVACGRRLAEVPVQAAALRTELTRKRLRGDAQQVGLWAARAALDRARPDEARAWLAATRIRSDDVLPSRLLACELRARLDAAAGRRGRALRRLGEGLDDLHAWVSQYGSHDLQSSAVTHGRSLSRLGLDLAAAEARPAVVFEWAERSRVLNSRVTPARPPTGAAEELQELRARSTSGAHASGVPGRAPRRSGAPSADEADLRERIRQHGWYTQSSGAAARPAPLAAVQAGLTERDTLLSLTVAGDELLGLRVTRHAADLFRLGSLAAVRAGIPRLLADLETSAGDDLPAGLRAAVVGSLDQQLGDLGEALLGPILDGAEVDRVVLVPTGRLNGVPWTLLPPLRGRSVTVARSATHWLSLLGRALPLRSVGFAVGPRLPYAAAEVAASASAWPGAEIELSATVDDIAALAERVDLLHVAAHGNHEGESPMFSGLELFDGPWFGYDIDQLQHVPDIVVLSACEVGASTVRAHEYLVGLTTAWLHAGAQCVIASGLAVNDRSTAEMLPAVHRRMAAGAPPAEALAAAMSASDHPAPFACYGRGW